LPGNPPFSLFFNEDEFGAIGPVRSTFAIECTHCTQLFSPSPYQMDAFQLLEGEDQVEEFDMVETEILQSGFLRDPLVNQLPVSCFFGFVAFGCWFVLY